MKFRVPSFVPPALLIFAIEHLVESLSHSLGFRISDLIDGMSILTPKLFASVYTPRRQPHRLSPFDLVPSCFKPTVPQRIDNKS